jgi:NAD(P)H-dependent flavin oxidoreductase YrpB (nitropropane dioxygenase family)
VSANLLLPFTRPWHARACIRARVAAVSLFFGFDRDLVAELRAAGILVLHQVGTVAQAERALAEGADALIAQGREAGGHLLAEEPLDAFLPRAIEAAAGRPVLAAGGIVDAADVRAALDAGAAAAWCGSRFLLTDESGAHPAYKARALGAPRTLETTLFGVGWPDRHRVLPNAATERWEHGGPVARAAGLAAKASRPLARILPLGATATMLGAQRAGVPLYSPAPPVAGMDERLVDVAPLYAGEAVRRIDRVVPAAEAVALLTP